MPDTDREPDVQRYVDEPPKDTSALPGPDERNPYEHDRARVLHSAAFRRLAPKTQVHTAAARRPGRPPPRGGAVRAGEGGPGGAGAAAGGAPPGRARAGAPPPFGHNGEDVLDGLCQAAGGFEGNAQTLRVLTRLEAKV